MYQNFVKILVFLVYILEGLNVFCSNEKLWTFKGIDLPTHLFFSKDEPSSVIIGSLSGVVSSVNTNNGSLYWRFTHSQNSTLLYAKYVNEFLILIFGEFNMHFDDAFKEQDNKRICNVFDEYLEENSYVTKIKHYDCFKYRGGSVVVLNSASGAVLFSSHYNDDFVNMNYRYSPIIDASSQYEKNESGDIRLKLLIVNYNQIHLSTIANKKKELKYTSSNDKTINSDEYLKYFKNKNIEQIRFLRIFSYKLSFAIVFELTLNSNTANKEWGIIYIDSDGNLLSKCFIEIPNKYSRSDIRQILVTDDNVVFIFVHENNYIYETFKLNDGCDGEFRDAVIHSSRFSFISKLHGNDIMNESESLINSFGSEIFGENRSVYFKNLVMSNFFKIRKGSMYFSSPFQSLYSDSIHDTELKPIQGVRIDDIITSSMSDGSIEIASVSLKKNWYISIPIQGNIQETEYYQSSYDSIYIIVTTDVGLITCLYFHLDGSINQLWTKNEIFSKLSSIQSATPQKIREDIGLDLNFINKIHPELLSFVKIYVKMLPKFILRFFGSTNIDNSNISSEMTIGSSCLFNGIVAFSTMNGSIKWKAYSPLKKKNIMNPIGLLQLCSYHSHVKNWPLVSLKLSDSETSNTVENSSFNATLANSYHHRITPQVIFLNVIDLAESKKKYNEILAVVWPLVPFVEWIDLNDGKQLFSPTKINIKTPVIIASYISDDGSSRLIAYNESDEIEHIRIPNHKQDDKIDISVYTYKNNQMIGYSILNSNVTKLNEIKKKWKLNYRKNEFILKSKKITSSETEYPSIECSSGYSIFKADLSHSAIVVTQFEENQHVYLLDTDSGIVVYEDILSGACLNIPEIITDENRFMILCNQKNNFFYQIIHYEVYYDMDNESELASLSNQEKKKFLHVIHKKYILSIPNVKKALVFKSKTKLSTSWLILMDNQGRVISIPYNKLSARRPEIKSHDFTYVNIRNKKILQCERHFPLYSPEVEVGVGDVLNISDFVSYSQDLIVIDTEFESSNIIIAYGLDVFSSLYQQDGGFDILKSGRNKYITILFVVSIIILFILIRQKVFDSVKKLEWR